MRARDVAQQRRELARQITKVTNDLNAMRSSRPRERYLTSVEVEARTAGELTLDVTYVVNSAAWQALYDIRAQLDGEAQDVQWSYLAQVTNNTGEDWNDVALTLSTARPALASIRPELSPWYLDRYEPTPVRTLSRAAPSAGMAEGAMPDSRLTCHRCSDATGPCHPSMRALRCSSWPA